MASINDPFSSVDFSDLPPLAKFTTRDGTQLAYRAYPSTTAIPNEGSVVLIHGSSATSSSMHPMAKAFSAAGYRVFALDIRGHGASGRKGQIAYIGQLEDDLADFMHAVSPPKPVTLAGFSSGGGFAIRIAGLVRRRFCDPDRRKQSAATFPELSAPCSVSQPGCADSALWKRRLDECRCAPHYRDRNSERVRY